MAISLDSIKKEIQKSGTSKGKFLYFKDGTKLRVRFLNDFEDGMEIAFHDSYALGINVPCQEIFGRDCEYCDMEDLRTRNLYAWSVYDYEAKEVKILMAAVNNCSPVGALASLYETYGTLTDRDYEIKRVGTGQGTTYSVIPLDKSKFRNPKAKPMSEQAILKCIDKAYPADNSENFEEEEEPKKKGTKKTTAKGKRPPMNEPEEEEEENNEDDWDEEETDYEEMSPQELYKLCKERDIDCKPRKSKGYYIDLLEESEEEDEDEWK